jgi:hypothetical protein
MRYEVRPPAPLAGPDVWDVEAVEVTPRLRALESLASAVRLTHGTHDDCELCDAMRRLDEAS